MSACPDDDQLLSLAEGRLAAEVARALLAHAGDCDSCRSMVALLSGDSQPARRAPRRGDGFGRYTILHPIGAGAAGVVHAAYDPKLDRKVALKILRAEVVTAHPEIEARLLREARALARLAHPNVVRVYDVGSEQGQLFVSMELVEGATLREWLRERHAWTRGLPLLLQVAQGLEAVHGAGVVHRDVKPENILVGSDGVARISDFGLARFASETETLPDDGVASPVVTASPLGTPAYMAPEQMAGSPAAPASDQFSFSVALYEAVHGERPFAGESLSGIYELIRRGPPAGSAGIPRALGAAIRRGLSFDPEARFASMGALIEHLQPLLQRRRRRVRAALGVALVGALAATALLLADRRTRPRRTCAAEAEQIQQVWNPGRKQALHAAFSRSGSSQAGPAASAVDRQLDEYAAAWSKARRDACEETLVRGRQSEELHELRAECLDKRRVGLSALLDVLLAADAGTADHAVEAASALAPLQGCARGAALKAALPLPADPQRRRNLETLSAGLARAQALYDAGRYREGTSAVDQVWPSITNAGHLPLVAETQLLGGRLDAKLGRLPEAAQSLQDAAVTAEHAGRDDLLATAASQLTYVVGYRQGRSAEGHFWNQLSGAAIRRIGGDDALEASRLHMLGALFTAEGKIDEAGDAFEAALHLRERAIGLENPLNADELMSLSSIRSVQGRLDEASQLVARALAMQEKLLGPRHPKLGFSLDVLAVLAQRRGHLEEAVRIERQALDLFTAAQGPDSPDLSVPLNNLATALLKLHRYGEAIAPLEHSLAIETKALHGVDNDSVAQTLVNLARALLGVGRPAEARALMERVIHIPGVVTPNRRAEAKFLLARSLWPAQRAQSLALAHEAAATLPAEELIIAAEIKSWLASR